MAELLDPNEIFFTPFEPKLQNRFIMYIEGVPAYLVKGAGRPNISFNPITLDHINVKRKVKGKGEWQDITIKLYDPIVPSAAQATMEWVRLSHESVTGRDGYSDFYKKDITLVNSLWSLHHRLPALLHGLSRCLSRHNNYNSFHTF